MDRAFQGLGIFSTAGIGAIGGFAGGRTFAREFRLEGDLFAASEIVGAFVGVVLMFIIVHLIAKTTSHE